MNRHYDQMLRDEAVDVDGSSSVPAPANSQDFLEKIFQVPFWLRRMDPPAVQRMIHSLVKEDEVEPDVRKLDTHQLGEGGTVLTPTARTSSTRRPSAVRRRRRRQRHRRKAGPALVAGEAEAYGVSIGEPVAPPTEALRIRQAELDFMDEVAPLMPRTPRAIKRFVNIYRLYKAALSTQGLDKFLGRPEHPGNYRAVQVLLALVIGTPDFAKAVVEILDDVQDSDARLSDIDRLIEWPADQTWQTTRDALAEFASDDGRNLPLIWLRDVSALVTRYSLHHMVSALPGESALS